VQSLLSLRIARWWIENRGRSGVSVSGASAHAATSVRVQACEQRAGNAPADVFGNAVHAATRFARILAQGRVAVARPTRAEG
jgi:hypothetical protein